MMIFYGGEKSGVQVMIAGSLLGLKQPAALYDKLGSLCRITSRALTKVIVSSDSYAKNEGFKNTSILDQMFCK